MDILSVFACFETLTTRTFRRQLALIVDAILSMSGRITMLSISRWTGTGGSYRTINRFFKTKAAWSELLVKFFETYLFDPANEYILAGDETVVGKAGRQTFGIDRYFSGLKGRAIKGLSFFVLSLINVRQRRSYPLMVKQVVRSEAEKAALKARREQAVKKRRKTRAKRRGRKKGSQNQNRNEPQFSPELLRINGLLTLLLKLLGVFVRVRYLAMDGHFGHQQAVLMARLNGLELISKLRRDAGLYEKYEGPYGGRGPRRKYGARLAYDDLPPKYLKKIERKAGVVTRYYQGIFLSKRFGMPLNVVIVEKSDLETQKAGHAILFSSDLELSWEKLVEYYSLRFQIEFNFRDAKQHFGLEDFMNQTETGVETGANLSFLMVMVSAKLLKEQAGNCVGINDLKSRYRGIKYAVETIKLVEPKAERILIERVKQVIGRIGSIHRPNVTVSSA